MALNSGRIFRDLRVFCCGLPALPYFRVIETRTYLDEDDRKEVDKQWGKRKLKEPREPGEKLEILNVDVVGCAPCSPGSGTLARRLSAAVLCALGRVLPENTDLALIGDHNKCLLDPNNLAALTFQLFKNIFGARPSLEDLVRFFLRCCAGYGGSPGGWRSVDWRLPLRVEAGSLSPRLDVDPVLHEEDHGLVKHLEHSDHGALRYIIGSASLEDEPPAAATAAAAAVDSDGDDAGGELSAAVWEQVFWFVGDKSLSSVPLNPLTKTQKALASLCPARSRLLQVRKRGRLDYLGSDVAGIAPEGWEAELVKLVSDETQRLETAKEEAGAMAVDGDEGAVPTDVEEAVLRVSEEEEEEEEEEDDDDDEDEEGSNRDDAGMEGRWLPEPDR